MGKTIRVNPEELGVAADKLNSISEEYTQIYTQLLQHANTMGDAWASEDNLAFVDQINGFCQDLKDMAARLNLAADTLRTQKQNYQNQQSTNIAQVKKLAN